MFGAGEACHKCGKFGSLQTCSKCKRAKYCSVGCQKADWKPRHKAECLPSNVGQGKDAKEKDAKIDDNTEAGRIVE
jgi:hypothetical protein